MPESITFWWWLVAGLVLTIAEMLLPGAYLLWLGIAAFATGGITWISADLSWQVQTVLFSLLSVLSIVVYRTWAKKHPTVTDQPALNRRAEQYIGRTFRLETPIENGVGRVKVGDSPWSVHCDEDLPIGTTVQVTGADGVILLVERAPANEQTAVP